MDYKSQGEAVQIAYASDNKLTFSTDAFREILEKTGNRPVAIVSINGPKRAEKTYILSQFLKYLSNWTDKNWFDLRNDKQYQWRNAADRQTPGISLWSEPLIIRKSGDEVAVLFMDTEGTFDEKTSTQDDLLIFALSFVLSSTLVQNVPEKMTEEVFQFLQLFTGYAKGSIDPNIKQIYSKLVFLVNDFNMPDYEFGLHDSGSTHPKKKNYKTDILLIDPDETKMPGEVQLNHNFIDYHFPNLACCLMPGDNSALNEGNSNLPNEFLESVKDIVPRIIHPSCVIIKRIGSKKFKAQDFIKFFDQLAVLFDEKEITQIKNNDDYSVEVKIFIACSVAFNYYIMEMDKIILKRRHIPDEELNQFHNSIAEKAIALFMRKMIMENETIGNKYESKKYYLQEAIEKAFDFYVQANVLRYDYFKLRQRNDKLREQMFEQVMELKNEFFTSFTDINNGISKLVGFDLESLTYTFKSVFGDTIKSGYY